MDLKKLTDKVRLWASKVKKSDENLQLCHQAYVSCWKFVAAKSTLWIALLSVKELTFWFVILAQAKGHKNQHRKK